MRRDSAPRLPAARRLQAPAGVTHVDAAVPATARLFDLARSSSLLQPIVAADTGAATWRRRRPARAAAWLPRVANTGATAHRAWPSPLVRCDERRGSLVAEPQAVEARAQLPHWLVAARLVGDGAACIARHLIDAGAEVAEAPKATYGRSRGRARNDAPLGQGAAVAQRRAISAVRSVGGVIAAPDGGGAWLVVGGGGLHCVAPVCRVATIVQRGPRYGLGASQIRGCGWHEAALVLILRPDAGIAARREVAWPCALRAVRSRPEGRCADGELPRCVVSRALVVRHRQLCAGYCRPLAAHAVRGDGLRARRRGEAG
mmetsp:Transcript_23040/g.71215  ORF Transcript_23040/g.71215 Transcript_23040/m.71215 type:complete len:316 (-) Transcript_23040:554-1501(-)